MVCCWVNFGKRANAIGKGRSDITLIRSRALGFETLGRGCAYLCLDCLRASFSASLSTSFRYPAIVYGRILPFGMQGPTANPNPPYSSPDSVDLVSAFRVLDGVAEVLGMIVEGREGTPVVAAAASLHSRFAAADALLDTLPGADMTRMAQLAEARHLTRVLAEKQALVAKYRDLALLVECRNKREKAAGGSGDGKEVPVRGEVEVDGRGEQGTSSEVETAAGGQATGEKNGGNVAMSDVNMVMFEEQGQAANEDGGGDAGENAGLQGVSESGLAKAGDGLKSADDGTAALQDVLDVDAMAGSF